MFNIDNVDKTYYLLYKLVIQELLIFKIKIFITNKIFNFVFIIFF